MFSKLLVLTLLLNLTLVLASPPACLLGAVNEYKDPSDIAAVCKSKDAATKIAKKCGDAAPDALAAFADICNDKGVEVSTKVPTSASASASASASTPATASGTGFPTPTGNGTVSATGIKTDGGSAPATATPSAPASAPGTEPSQMGAAGRVEMAGGAVAFLAGLGVVLAAL